MKKLLGSTLALAMIAPAGASAELLKNFKVSGQLDVQATSADNVTDFVTRPTGANSTPASTANHDHIGAANTRVMVKADWDLLDDVHSRITLVKGANNHSTTRPYGAGPENANTVQSNTYVTEANVKIDKVFGALDTTIGRQYYGEPGDIVVYYGPKDNYGLNVTGLDAFRLDWNRDNVALTGIAGKVDGANGLGANVQSVDLRGINAMLKSGDNLQGGAYVYNKVTHSVNGIGAPNGGNDVLWVGGVKAKVNVMGLMINGEIAKNMGQNRSTGAAATPALSSNYSGWAMKLKAAYKADLASLGMVMPWAEFGYGSGRSRSGAVSNHNDGFVAIASDYRPGGIYGRFMDTGAGALLNGGGAAATVGLSNKVIYGVGAKVTPAAWNKLTVGLSGWKYAFARTSDTATFGNTQLSRSIGTEVDVTANWKHSENVWTTLTLGSFQPGAYFYDLRQPNAAVNPARMVALDTSVRF